MWPIRGTMSGMTTVSRLSDRAPEAVAGGAVAVSFAVPAVFALALLVAASPLSYAPGNIVAAIALLVGIAVLARTLLAGQRIAAVLLLAGAVLGAAVAVTSVVADRASEGSTAAVFSSGYQALFTVMEVASVAGAACLVAGAVVVARRRASGPSLRRGLVVVAAVTALPLARDLLIEVGARAHVVGPDTLLVLGPWYSPMTLALSLVGMAGGVSIAWPALREPLHRARLAVARVHRRHVDSTP